MNVAICTIYRTQAIVTCSCFETTLDHKPQIFLKNFLVYYINRCEKWGKNIQAAAYNVASKVFTFS